MKTQMENNQKRAYFAPQIKQIKLDNEISLVLESEPPLGPGESLLKAPEYFNNDPFKLAQQRSGCVKRGKKMELTYKMKT